MLLAPVFRPMKRSRATLIDSRQIEIRRCVRRARLGSPMAVVRRPLMASDASFAECALRVARLGRFAWSPAREPLSMTGQTKHLSRLHHFSLIRTRQICEPLKGSPPKERHLSRAILWLMRCSADCSGHGRGSVIASQICLLEVFSLEQVLAPPWGGRETTTCGWTWFFRPLE